MGLERQCCQENTKHSTYIELLKEILLLPHQSWFTVFAPHKYSCLSSYDYGHALSQVAKQLNAQVDTPMKQIGFGKNDGMQSGRTVESGV
jgi:hypothetical protein